MNNFLFKQIDNTGLTLFRIVFGLLITIEAFGAIATGWVRRVMVDPEFTFNFIGFDFLQNLQGPGMYAYFVVMGVFGLGVMLGYKYRMSMFAYAFLWTGAYLMQKTSYNNHYYLMVLLCWVMVLLPAHRRYSLDVKFKPSFKKLSMPQWCKWMLVLQVFIVFTYGAIAKWYPDWLNGTAPAMFMKSKSDYWLIGGLLQESWMHYSIAYFGILFDLLIIPMLLWKPTRLLGFYLSLFFHLFNSVVFQVGIFPYMSIAFALFFFSSESIQKLFKLQAELYNKDEVLVPKYKNLLIFCGSLYFIVQIGLPLRHWGIKDDVLWTEEGHRMSWRMMLRAKSGTLTMHIENKETGERIIYNYRNHLSKKQARSLPTKADLMWQLAQRIKKEENAKGNEIAIYVTSRVSVNGGPFFPFINPEIDIASQKWKPYSHLDWILPSPNDYHKKGVTKK
ncbi:MAG: vitamin K-dependent gamma-carboxylase [Flavobacteriaceae bacterium]|jgi:vitamin K-dependent gamma-carboxylase|uniref:HTTM domain-containing protein n=1 Tax=Candidatus Marifrigoribacter sp. Uisw_064 TaxID=3230970 RepID=UPI003ADBA194